MTDEAWDAGFVKCLGVRLAGDLIGEVDERGEPIVGDTLLILINAHHEADPVHAAGDRRRSTAGSCCSTRRTTGSGTRATCCGRSLAGPHVLATGRSLACRCSAAPLERRRANPVSAAAAWRALPRSERSAHSRAEPSVGPQLLRVISGNRRARGRLRSA